MFDSSEAEKMMVQVSSLMVLLSSSSSSRACRLKKKAQHEANKIKLWGLNQEYGRCCRSQVHVASFISYFICV